MKKLILSLSSLFIGIASFAQISVVSDTVEYGGFPRPTGDSHKQGFVINNNSTDSVTIIWDKVSDNFLSGWSGSSICDWTDCYGYDGTAHTKKLAPGQQGAVYVGMSTTASAVAGCSYTTVRFKETGTPESKYITYKYCAWPTATKDFDNNNIVSIYPNPASSYVNITLNDKKIKGINVLNVIGRKIAFFEVDASKSSSMRVPLDNIADGLYMLQFSDANGKMLGVRRITKQ